MNVTSFSYSTVACENDNSKSCCCCSKDDETNKLNLPINKVELTNNCKCEFKTVSDLNADKNFAIVPEQTLKIFSFSNFPINYFNYLHIETHFFTGDNLNIKIDPQIHITNGNFLI
ncbi:MAG: hypothetical protein H8D45_04140 [Bacteroidetes bacterium]|nr:hypothetical protein [Bacteroidota bacterium]